MKLVGSGCGVDGCDTAVTALLAAARPHNDNLENAAAPNDAAPDNALDAMALALELVELEARLSSADNTGTSSAEAAAASNAGSKHIMKGCHIMTSCHGRITWYMTSHDS